MGFHEIAGALCRALTARKDGPSLYDVCDPVLANYRGGDAHLGKFYRTALSNPALRPLLRRTGLSALKEPERLARLRAALVAARDEAAPDWAAIGAPVAELMGDINVRHPAPPATGAPARTPATTEIDREEFGANWNLALEAGGWLVSKAVQVELDVLVTLRTDQAVP